MSLTVNVIWDSIMPVIMHMHFNILGYIFYKEKYLFVLFLVFLILHKFWHIFILNWNKNYWYLSHIKRTIIKSSNIQLYCHTLYCHSHILIKYTVDCPQLQPRINKTCLLIFKRFFSNVLLCLSLCTFRLINQPVKYWYIDIT